MNVASPPITYIEKFCKLLNATRKSGKKERSQLILNRLINKYLPPWFIPMMNDKNRNIFYQKMIKRHVKDKTVLEIGTGIGFLSLMAAEYGAKHVYACELNPLMYYLAKENIENGPYADKITLYFAHSDTLKLGTHIPEKVDIILSELISSDIFSENMVPTLTNAKNLLKDNGIFLPSAVEGFGCLIEIENNIPSKIKSPDNITQLLKKLTETQSTYLDLNLFPFKVISNPIKLFELENGYKNHPELPITFEIEKNKKAKNTFFCIYFSINDGKNKLLNLDIVNKKNNCHWGNQVWELENTKSKFELKLINQDDRLYLLQDNFSRD